MTGRSEFRSEHSPRCEEDVGCRAAGRAQFANPHFFLALDPLILSWWYVTLYHVPVLHRTRESNKKAVTRIERHTL